MSGLDFPELDSAAIREKAVDDLFDKLEAAHKEVVAAAQRHGETLSGPRDEWIVASETLVARKTMFALILGTTRREILRAVHDAEVPVVFDRAAS